MSARVSIRLVHPPHTLLRLDCAATCTIGGILQSLSRQPHCLANLCLFHGGRALAPLVEIGSLLDAASAATLVGSNSLIPRSTAAAAAQIDLQAPSSPSHAKAEHSPSSPVTPISLPVSLTASSPRSAALPSAATSQSIAAGSNASLASVASASPVSAERSPQSPAEQDEAHIAAIASESQRVRAERAALLGEMMQRELVDDALPQEEEAQNDDDDDMPGLFGESSSSASESESHPPLLADSEDEGNHDGNGEGSEFDDDDGQGDDDEGDGGGPVLDESENDEDSVENSVEDNDEENENQHADEEGDDEDAAALEESVSALISMGFPRAQVLIALRTSGFDVDVAATRLLMAGADELPAWEVGQALDVQVLNQWRAGRVMAVADDASAVRVRATLPDGAAELDEWIAADSQRLAPAETHVAPAPAPSAAAAAVSAAGAAAAEAAASSSNASAAVAAGSAAP